MNDESKINQITWQGVVINLVLVGLKTLVGLAFGSIALVADALHSLSDLATDAMVFIGVKFGAKPADATHPYGHGKIETMATVGIAVVLVAAGGAIAWKAGQGFKQPSSTPAGWAVLSVALLSVVMKEWLFQKTVQVARQTRSSAVMANAWHHRSDALSSLVVLVGAVAVLLGWPYGDQTAGVFVGIMVAYAGLKIGLDCFHELGEAAVDKTTTEHLKNIIENQTGVAAWHKLRARQVGREIVMDIHILVDPKLTVIEGHAISDKVEKAVNDGMNRHVNITVHIEPNLPEERARS